MTRKQFEDDQRRQAVAFGAMMLERVRPGGLASVDISKLSFNSKNKNRAILPLVLNTGAEKAHFLVRKLCPEFANNTMWEFGFCPKNISVAEANKLRKEWIGFVEEWQALCGIIFVSY